jgi:predicted nuclease with TOPRIM domain
MALIGQQLRNAVLNAKTREVLRGQKAISRLSDELIKDISRTVGITTQDSEKLIYAGFYNIEAAKEAVTTVIKSCEEIHRTASEMLPKMKADMTQLGQLLKELEPCVSSGERTESESVSQNVSPTVDTKLKF